MNEQTNNVFSYRTYALLPRQRGKKFGFEAHVRSQKPALGRDDSSDGGLLLSYRPLLKSDASLITPIGDGAVSDAVTYTQSKPSPPETTP